MLGKTHTVLGIASSLLITRPTTVPEVIIAVTGGALGGWIVDIDIRNRGVNTDPETDRETIYDGIIAFLFISIFVILDFLIGKGMCRYVTDNWGVPVWGSMFAFIILLLIGLNSKHRHFTHSFFCMALFTVVMYFFCRPLAIPFGIGYASHIVADLTNKEGVQILFPLPWKPCLNKCYSNKDANTFLFWISFAIDIVLGAYLFSSALSRSGEISGLLTRLSNSRLFGLNILQIYLIFINLLTFFGFLRYAKLSYRESYYNTDKTIKTQIEFEVWFLDFLVFIGGGIGILLYFIRYAKYPAAYNGNWWAFCYMSILMWITAYSYICNPFLLKVGTIKWISLQHIPLLAYILSINVISALYVYTIRKKRFNEYNVRHTLLFILGALGGTIGAIISVFATHHKEKFYYVITGFFMMLMSQIVFIMYMMMTGVL
ncbi:MAG: metal-dependent hydrolase [Agathobacter sp.]|nr:metal-dependent hydrolase [Agathobacter sp.]